MPPGRFARLRVRGFKCGNRGGNSERRSHRGHSSALKKMSSGNRQCRIPVSNSGPVKTHYKARIRPIKLLFPHLASLSMALVRRNVPITRTRRLETKRLETKRLEAKRLEAKRPGRAWP